MNSQITQLMTFFSFILSFSPSMFFPFTLSFLKNKKCKAQSAAAATVLSGIRIVSLQLDKAELNQADDRQ